MQLNTFRVSSCPSSGAYQLQHQPLVYRRNVVVAVLLFVVGPVGPTTTNSKLMLSILNFFLQTAKISIFIKFDSPAFHGFRYIYVLILTTVIWL
jgi:hypothetical protein